MPTTSSHSSIVLPPFPHQLQLHCTAACCPYLDLSFLSVAVSHSLDRPAGAADGDGGRKSSQRDACICFVFEGKASQLRQSPQHPHAPHAAPKRAISAAVSVSAAQSPGFCSGLAQVAGPCIKDSCAGAANQLEFWGMAVGLPRRGATVAKGQLVEAGCTPLHDHT